MKQNYMLSRLRLFCFFIFVLLDPSKGSARILTFPQWNSHYQFDGKKCEVKAQNPQKIVKFLAEKEKWIHLLTRFPLKGSSSQLEFLSLVRRKIKAIDASYRNGLQRRERQLKGQLQNYLSKREFDDSLGVDYLGMLAQSFEQAAIIIKNKNEGLQEILQSLKPHLDKSKGEEQKDSLHFLWQKKEEFSIPVEFMEGYQAAKKGLLTPNGPTMRAEDGKSYFQVDGDEVYLLFKGELEEVISIFQEVEKIYRSMAQCHRRDSLNRLARANTRGSYGLPLPKDSFKRSMQSGPEMKPFIFEKTWQAYRNFLARKREQQEIPSALF